MGKKSRRKLTKPKVKKVTRATPAIATNVINHQERLKKPNRYNTLDIMESVAQYAHTYYKSELSKESIARIADIFVGFEHLWNTSHIEEKDFQAKHDKILEDLSNYFHDLKEANRLFIPSTDENATLQIVSGFFSTFCKNKMIEMEASDFTGKYSKKETIDFLDRSILYSFIVLFSLDSDFKKFQEVETVFFDPKDYETMPSDLIWDPLLIERDIKVMRDLATTIVTLENKYEDDITIHVNTLPLLTAGNDQRPPDDIKSSNPIVLAQRHLYPKIFNRFTIDSSDLIPKLSPLFKNEPEYNDMLDFITLSDTSLDRLTLKCNRLFSDMRGKHFTLETKHPLIAAFHLSCVIVLDKLIEPLCTVNASQAKVINVLELILEHFKEPKAAALHKTAYHDWDAVDQSIFEVVQLLIKFAQNQKITSTDIEKCLATIEAINPSDFRKDYFMKYFKSGMKNICTQLIEPESELSQYLLNARSQMQKRTSQTDQLLSLLDAEYVSTDHPLPSAGAGSGPMIMNDSDASDDEATFKKEATPKKTSSKQKLIEVAIEFHEKKNFTHIEDLKDRCNQITEVALTSQKIICSLTTNLIIYDFCMLQFQKNNPISKLTVSQLNDKNFRNKVFMAMDTCIDALSQGQQYLEYIDKNHLSPTQKHTLNELETQTKTKLVELSKAWDIFYRVRRAFLAKIEAKKASRSAAGAGAGSASAVKDKDENPGSLISITDINTKVQDILSTYTTSSEKEEGAEECKAETPENSAMHNILATRFKEAHDAGHKGKMKDGTTVFFVPST